MMKPTSTFWRWATVLELIITGILLISLAACGGTKAATQKTKETGETFPTETLTPSEGPSRPLPTSTVRPSPTPTREPTATVTATPTATPRPTETPPSTTTPTSTVKAMAQSSPTATAKQTAQPSPGTPTGSEKATPTKMAVATPGALLCTTRIIHVFTSPGSSQSCGILDPAAEVKVIDYKSGWYKVAMPGWQPASSKSVVYALEGIRIRKALLKKCAQGNVKVLKTVTDPATDQKWHQVNVTDLWIPEKDMDSTLDPVWKSVSVRYSKTCSVCHALHPPSQFTANQWPGILKAMTPRTSLSKDQIAWVTKYLQYNAKDTSKAGIPLPCRSK